MICFKNSSTDVYFNLALDEYLLKSDIKDNIFFLWKNFNTIVIGRNQNTIEEINLQAVEADKVNVARRITGGGAVYQDDGNLCFSIIVNKDDKIAQNYESILQPIINVLQKLGLNAKFAGKNDIEIDDGTAGDSPAPAVPEQPTVAPVEEEKAAGVVGAVPISNTVLAHVICQVMVILILIIIKMCYQHQLCEKWQLI